MTRRAVRVRRIYDPAASDDGIRVLADRVWPRGIRKEAAAIDEWAKDVAPSTELRKWYGHVPEKFAQFEALYRDELATPPTQAALDHPRTLAKDHALTLLTATRDVDPQPGGGADRPAAGTTLTDGPAHRQGGSTARPGY